ncbi:GerAB/ArcD/ProY family transporter [Clostridium aciditolerans]|uniref:GerAB/ArcD/ProY family transporter n=1 Tax=Clostridium aciditolerans TaxID=339861 RepID=A0A934HYW5_9CLOT|nr:GerAB/ArcD/ProY family transporter [Clostridium aciditolerans]MBI6873774.1 GerAB/ArcD/ProY family transporter [Clostridium aciditolerans]
MQKDRNSITSTQVMTFMLNAQVGVGILSLPASLAKTVGHDGWICVIAANFISIISGILITFFLKRYHNKSILEINKLLYGKYIGTFNNYILVIYTYVLPAYILREFVELIKIAILRNTPAIILSFFVMIPSIYLVWYGLKNVCRYGSIFYFSIATMMVLLILVSKNIRLTFLQPVGESGIRTIIKGTGTVTLSFLGYELLAFICPNVMEKNKITKSAITAIFLAGFFYTSVVIVSTGIFGENRLKFMMFPLFSLTRTYKSMLLERVDLFFISFWMPVMAGAIRAYYFCAYYNSYKLLNIKNKKVLITLCTIIIVLISRIPKDQIQISNFEKIVSIYGIAVIGFLLVSYAFSFVNKRGVNSNAKNN